MSSQEVNRLAEDQPEGLEPEMSAPEEAYIPPYVPEASHVHRAVGFVKNIGKVLINGGGRELLRSLPNIKPF